VALYRRRWEWLWQRRMDFVADEPLEVKERVNMTELDLVNRVREGEALMVGEYRMSKAEILKWRDKITGKPQEAPILRHTVEFGKSSVSVNERVADGTRLEDIHVTFNKGDAVVLHVDELTRAKGLVSCRGRLEKLTPSSASSSGVAGGKAAR